MTTAHSGSAPPYDHARLIDEGVISRALREALATEGVWPPRRGKTGRFGDGPGLSRLRSRAAHSGTMPVVIPPGTGGVLFNGAWGHGLEADHIAKAVSVFSGRVGEQVGSPLVTLVGRLSLE